MEKFGKILKTYETNLENIAFDYTGSYSIMHLLPCFHYISPTFCGQNFDIVSILAKTILTHLYCQHHLKSKKFCHDGTF